MDCRRKSTRIIRCRDSDRVGVLEVASCNRKTTRRSLRQTPTPGARAVPEHRPSIDSDVVVVAAVVLLPFSFVEPLNSIVEIPLLVHDE